MSSPLAITVENLTKIYKLYSTPKDRLKEALNPFKRKYHHDFRALDNINFEIAKGDTVGIVGQNGAGKSTLLKVITSVIAPTVGQVKVNGRISALLELGAGFNPDISGLENVYFNGTLMGFSKEEMDQKIEDILAFADIGDFINQPVKIYSSGMFVRLAFSLATHIDPEVLIIDEALSVGDVMFQAKCFDKIKSLMEGGVTTLFVTHNVNTLASFCSRAILLDGGSIFADGNPKDVCLTYFELQRKREHEQKEKQNPRKTAAAKSSADSSFKTSRDGEEQRFGSGAAEIADFRIYNNEGQETSALATGEIFSINVDVTFHLDVDNPAVGAMIKNPQGQGLLGIHTYHDNRINLGKKTKGERLSLKLESEMLLNPGRYTLNIGVANVISDTDYDTLDSRHNVAVIEVFGKHHSYGTINNFRHSKIEVL